jgi:hypothetical protein
MGPLTIQQALHKLFEAMNGSFWTTFLLSVAGLGTLTMAILQAIKQGIPIRRWFQKYQMANWLKLHASVAKQNLGLDPCWTKAEEQIILLSTDGDAGAFYDLEIEKLCGQWNAAIQIVIDSPATYLDFFSCVAARASKTDFDEVMRRALPEPSPVTAEAKPTPEEQISRLPRRQEFMDARYRVAHQVQRAVDSFQIKTSFRWKWMFQIASFALSFFLALSAMKISTHDTHIGQTLIWAAVAGFLAPVARDLLAAIQKLNS